MRKLNLGAGPKWKSSEWDAVDHKRVDRKGRRVQAWRLPYNDNEFDAVFTAHMLEHISHFMVERTICEINRVMKPGGVLRVLVPDLKKHAVAYIKGDSDFFRNFKNYSLGIGHAFVNTIVSTGEDSILLDNAGEVIGGYAHVFAYDFDMMEKLLSHYGFCEIYRADGYSDIEGYDDVHSKGIDRHVSLAVECRKDKHIAIDKDNMLMMVGRADYRKNRSRVKGQIT